MSGASLKFDAIADFALDREVYDDLAFVEDDNSGLAITVEVDVFDIDLIGIEAGVGRKTRDL
jgi:hypothetical protein